MGRAGLCASYPFNGSAKPFQGFPDGSGKLAVQDLLLLRNFFLVPWIILCSYFLKIIEQPKSGFQPLKFFLGLCGLPCTVSLCEIAPLECRDVALPQPSLKWAGPTTWFSHPSTSHQTHSGPFHERRSWSFMSLERASSALQLEPHSWIMKLSHCHLTITCSLLTNSHGLKTSTMSIPSAMTLTSLHWLDIHLCILSSSSIFHQSKSVPQNTIPANPWFWNRGNLPRDQNRSSIIIIIIERKLLTFAILRRSQHQYRRRSTRCRHCKDMTCGLVQSQKSKRINE